MFLVPGLIVLGIVAVWLLVSRMASVEQDWRSLVNDIQSPQDHIRSRGIFGLAQQLLAEQSAVGPGQKLRDNPEIAQLLSDYLIKELKRSSPDEATIKQQAILTRTLGMFHQPDVVLPALAQAVQSNQDVEVRKNALGSVAVIAGRAMEQDKPLKLDLIQPAVIEASSDPAPLIRQLAAFDLGLLPGEASQQRLKVLLSDSDLSTRVNVAVGLARQDSAAGFGVLKDVLETAATKPATIGSQEEFSQFTQVKNALVALDKVKSKLDEQQRADLIKVLEPLSETYREPKLRIEAQMLLKSLRGT